ncbi:hypothetical protein IFM89_019321, partial [Coptis chinensis]
WRIVLKEAKALALCKSKPATTVELSSKDDEMLIKKPKEPPSINIATFEHSRARLCSNGCVFVAIENFSKTHIIGEGDRIFGEMETIGKVKHLNLVQLLGYCVYGDERFLHIEYKENGSLDMWLRSRADAVEALDGRSGFKICLGSARGHAFLHHGFVPHIIHRGHQV